MIRIATSMGLCAPTGARCTQLLSLAAATRPVKVLQPLPYFSAMIFGLQEPRKRPAYRLLLLLTGYSLAGASICRIRQWV